MPKELQFSRSCQLPTLADILSGGDCAAAIQLPSCLTHRRAPHNTSGHVTKRRRRSSSGERNETVVPAEDAQGGGRADVIAIALLPSVRALLATVEGVAKLSGAVSLRFCMEEIAGDANDTVLIFPYATEDGLSEHDAAVHATRDDAFDVDGTTTDVIGHDHVVSGGEEEEEKRSTTTLLLPSHLCDVDEAHEGGCQTSRERATRDTKALASVLSAATRSSVSRGSRPTSSTPILRTARVIVSAVYSTLVTSASFAAGEFTCASSWCGHSEATEADVDALPLVVDECNLAPWLDGRHNRPPQSSSLRTAAGREVGAIGAVGCATRTCGCGTLAFSRQHEIPRSILVCSEHYQRAWGTTFPPNAKMLRPSAHPFVGLRLCHKDTRAHLSGDHTSQSAITSSIGNCHHHFGLCHVHEAVPPCQTDATLRRTETPCSKQRIVEAFVSSAHFAATLARLVANDDASALSQPVRCIVTSNAIVLDTPPLVRAASSNPAAAFLRYSEFQLPRLFLPGESMLRASAFYDAEEFGLRFACAESDANCFIRRAAADEVDDDDARVASLLGVGMLSGLRLVSSAPCERSTFRVGFSDVLHMMAASRVAKAVEGQADDGQEDISTNCPMSIFVDHLGNMCLLCKIGKVMTYRLPILDWGPTTLARHHGDTLLFRSFEEEALLHPQSCPVVVPDAEWSVSSEDLTETLRCFLAPFRGLLSCTTSGMNGENDSALNNGVELFVTPSLMTGKLIWTVRVPTAGLSARLSMRAD